MLSADKLTVKAAEALQKAATEARQRGNAEVHGVPILHKLEVTVELVRSRR